LQGSYEQKNAKKLAKLRACEMSFSAVYLRYKIEQTQKSQQSWLSLFSNLNGSGFGEVWCPEEDSNLHDSHR
jgi:hypothetical protein